MKAGSGQVCAQGYPDKVGPIAPWSPASLEQSRGTFQSGRGGKKENIFS